MQLAAWYRNHRQHLWKAGKDEGPIFQRLWVKDRGIWEECIGVLCSFHAVPRLSISCFILKIYLLLKLPSSYTVVKNVQQSVVFGPRFLGEGIPQIMDMNCSNFADFQPCGKFWLSFI